MKRLLLFGLMIVLFHFTLTAQEKRFKISGIINGDYSDYIFLTYGKKKDSTKVNNNRFEFAGQVDKPIKGWLNLRPDATIIWVWVENSNIEISGDFIRSVRENKRPVNHYELNEIKGSFIAKVEEDYVSFYQTNKTKDDFSSLLYAKLQTLIKENSNHPWSGRTLRSLVTMDPILTKDEFHHLYSLMDTMQQDKTDLEIFEKGMANLGRFGVGKPFAKFKLPDSHETETDIVSYLGKITLVDFWASWCGPCRAKHPELIKLKNEFENNNFDILSISIDTDKINWLKAIEKDKLPWTNLLDINKKVCGELGIVAIPYNYLLDENGIILGTNLSLENIKKILNAINGK